MNSQTTDSNEVDLQARLEDRERLVEALTSRLEQAAEQLDRLKRSGAGRGGRTSGGGGVPPELLEQQKSLTEELRQAVQNWEDMQPTVLLSRLEMQLGELRDMMQGGLQFPAQPATGFSGAPGGVPSASPASPATQQPATAAEPDEDLSELSIYEQFKRGLELGDAPAPPARPSIGQPPPAAAPPQVEEPAPAAAEEAEPELEPPPPPLAQIPSVEPPEPIDFETADEQTLRDAVDQRDSFIVYLLKRLRAHEVSARPNGDWRALEDKPGELAVRLEEYEKQIEEMLRLAEVETSLERARLGREAADLEFQRHQIQSVMAHLEMQADAEDDANDPQNGESKTKPSRLRRFLGRRKSADE